MATDLSIEQFLTLARNAEKEFEVFLVEDVRQDSGEGLRQNDLTGAIFGLRQHEFGALIVNCSWRIASYSGRLTRKFLANIATDEPQEMVQQIIVSEFVVSIASELQAIAIGELRA